MAAYYFCFVLFSDFTGAYFTKSSSSSINRFRRVLNRVTGKHWHFCRNLQSHCLCQRSKIVAQKHNFLFHFSFLVRTNIQSFRISISPSIMSLWTPLEDENPSNMFSFSQIPWGLLYNILLVFQMWGQIVQMTAEGLELPRRNYIIIIYEIIVIYLTVPSPRRERDIIGVLVVASVTKCWELFQDARAFQLEGLAD